MRRWSRSPDGVDELGVAPRPVAIAVVKGVHTVAWASIEACVLYVLWAGLRGRSDRRVGVAAAVVAGESLVFAANGFRCPLTALATRYGAESGSVTDIYLPRWFAHNLPAIHAPLLVLMAWLHVRNLGPGGMTSAGPQGNPAQVRQLSGRMPWLTNSRWP